MSGLVKNKFSHMFFNLLLLVVILASSDLWAFQCHDNFSPKWESSYFFYTTINVHEEIGLLNPREHEVDNYEKFIDRHINFKLPENANKSYISWAREKFDKLLDWRKAKLFLVSSFVYIKDLNDHVLKNKRLVTAMINLHKKIFFSELFRWIEIDGNGHMSFKVNATKYPMIDKYLLASYSDFKSGNLAFAEPSKTDVGPINREIQEVMQRANFAFGRIITRSGIIFENPLRDSLSDPYYWVKGGLGETADQAGVASLQARKVEKHSKRNLLVKFEEVESQLGDMVQRANEILQDPRIMTLKINSDLFVNDKIFNKEWGLILAPAVIEILIKTKPRRDEHSYEAYLIEVRQALRAQFSVDVSIAQVKLLKEYKDILNEFIPQLEIVNRVVLDYTSPEGITLVDFTGQNVYNHYYTQWALYAARHSKDPRVAIKLSRRGEQLATAELNNLKRLMDRWALAIHGKKASFTGDDGIIPSDKFKIFFLGQIVESPLADHFRITFVSKNVPVALRDRWGTQGEDFQKKIMKELKTEFGYEVGTDYFVAVSILPNKEIKVFIKRISGKPVSGRVYSIATQIVRDEVTMEPWRILGFPLRRAN